MPDSLPAPGPAPANTNASLEMDPKDIESGKTMAILCYLPIALVNLIVSIVCLSQKNNAFSLYHAKQSLALIICTFIAMAICIPLMCIGIGIVGWLLVGPTVLVLTILGIINAASGHYKPLPLVGGFAARWFTAMKQA